MRKNIRFVLGIFSLILTIGAVLGYIFAPDNAVVEFLFGSTGLMAMALPAGVGTKPPTGTPTDPTTQTAEGTINDPETKELDKWDVDERVLWARPDINPLNCLTRRLRKTKTINSQKFKFWTATQNEGIYTTDSANDITATSAQDGAFDLKLDANYNDLLIDDVLGMVLDMTSTTPNLGYHWGGSSVAPASATVPLIIQIVGKTAANEYKAIVVNDGGTGITITIPKGSTFFRIGNAKDELDVMNDAFNLMPKVDFNYAQRFMKVVSESDYQARIGKEATWGLEEYRRSCMYAFLSEIELSGFIGQRRLVQPYQDKGEVFYTGGAEDFLSIIASHNLTTGTGSSKTNNPLKLADIQDWGRKVFSTINGSTERYMFVSPIFMQAILNIPELQSANNTILRVTDAVDLENKKLGFSIRKLDTGYGIINLVMHKGLAKRRDYRGYIFDLENIQRCILDPAQTRKVDLEEKLIKKANAYIIQECSGLKFQNVESMGMIDLIP